MSLLRNIVLIIYFVIIIKEFGECRRRLERPIRRLPSKQRFDMNEDIIHFPTEKLKVLQKSKAEQMCDEYVKLACNNANNQTKHRIHKRKIVGGTNAAAKKYPHMALIGYGDKSNIEWLCGGSLISNRFVLSAAHCAYSFNLGYAEWVRLGELVLNTHKDDASPMDFRITDRFVHPDYKNTSIYYDIVLFKVDPDVTFNNYIHPICLYTKENVGIIDFPIATGWGQTEIGNPTSESLQQVDLEFIPIERCATNYGTESKFQRGLDVKTMMCAGSYSGGRDTCLGDSGGPLVIKISNCSSMYYQIGITSFGRSCAQVNHPGVYTKVSSYIQWIESIAWK